MMTNYVYLSAVIVCMVIILEAKTKQKLLKFSKFSLCMGIFAWICAISDE
jgi:hypothetical protein